VHSEAAYGVLRSTMRAEYKNQILSRLSRTEIARLRPNLEQLLLPQKKDLGLPGQNALYGYFLEEGMASIVVTMRNGASVEVGIAGREGLIGLPILLGTGHSPTHAFMQIPGSGFRIAAQVLKAEFDRPGTFRDLCNRWVQSQLVQVSNSAACNRIHNIEQRLARWLLLSQDKTALARLPLTHEFLSQMLGTGRATVSLAAAILQRSNLIICSRGKVDILDRKGLERMACECYHRIHAEEERLSSLS